MSLIEKYEGKLSKLVGERVRITTDDNYDEDLNGVEFGIYIKEVYSNEIANFQVCQLPGCCGVAVSYDAFVNTPHRRKGIGTILNQFRIEWAKQANYGLLICTDIEYKNGAQEKIMKKNGWGELIDFVNPKTKNIVKMYAIKL